MIHGPDGQKLSKRHGAVSVMQYDADGFLPEAVVNYLARLGWSHGDDETFPRERLVEWFDGTHLSHSPSQFDLGKLKWLNNHYLKAMPDDVLAARVAPRLAARGIQAGPGGAGVAGGAGSGPDLAAACGLFKDRAATLEELADLAAMLWREPSATNPGLVDALAQQVRPEAVPALAGLADRLAACEWSREGIAAAIRETLAAHALKMPQLAVPVRLKVFGVAQTPSLDATLALMPRETVVRRLRA
jgi:glutamyl-tRNA synthetase